MEASLTTVRLTHRALTAVAATTLVFAASFRFATDYDAAHRELEVITGVYPNQYEEFNINWRNERAFISRGELIKLIKDGAKDLNVEFDLHQFEYEQIQPPWLSGPRFDGTLAELQTDLQAQQVVRVTVDKEDLREQLSEQIQNNKFLNLPATSDASTPGQRPIFTFFALELRMLTSDASRIDVRAIIMAGQIMVAVAPETLEFSVSAKRSPKGMPGIRDWFAKTTKLGSSYKNRTLFPALQPFWTEVRSMKPLQAYGRISALRERSKKDVTILGLTFAQDLAILAAPLTISLLTIYLLCHIAHIGRLARESDKSKEVVVHFPWIALFDEKLARFLNDTSIALLPFLANLLLIWKFQHAGWLLLAIALMLTVVSAVIGWLARSGVAQLRRRIHEWKVLKNIQTT